jgi:hypothetical protein
MIVCDQPIGATGKRVSVHCHYTAGTKVVALNGECVTTNGWAIVRHYTSTTDTWRNVIKAQEASAGTALTRDWFLPEQAGK